jgi:SAM-dependent methyltransferase
MSKSDSGAGGKSLHASARTRGCEVCACRRFETIAERDRRGDVLETVACWRCGLVSHARIPTDDELAHYYEEEYRQDYNGEETPSPRRVVREWNRGRQRFERLQPFVAAGERVFEIGAGIGCNLKHFELAGFDASGIEPGAGFGRFSREQLHAQVRPGFWRDVPSAPAYDLVLLIHVLEHLNSPSQALRHIRQILRPGGRLFIEVPNLAAPHAAPSKLFHYAHVYNYTPWTLAMLARASGFAVTRVFSEERNRNLAMLLTRSNEFTLEVDPASYLKTIRAVTRHNTWTYHLRPSYVWERCGEIGGVLWERATASTTLRAILKQCAATSAGSGGSKPKEQRRVA